MFLTSKALQQSRLLCIRCIPWFCGSVVHTLPSNIFHTNPASRRVLEKSGFEREGIARKAVVKNGKILDVWTYGKVNPRL